jgi:hypothetical protein
MEKKKILEIVDTNILILSFHFGLLASWLANEKLTPLLFSEEFSERSLFIKFVILLIYATFFTIGFYFLLNQLESIFLKIKSANNKYFGKRSFLIQRRLFLELGEIFDKKWFKLLFIIFISLLASFYIFGENLKAQWWIIDDHEIMAFLGDDGNLDLKEIPNKLLADTEVGGFGAKSRYRPSYYFLRLLETSLWGNNPQLFYLTRLIICSFFIFVCWLIVKDNVGFIGSFIFTMAVMSFNYWTDIFSRLGPGETYVVLGFSLFALGIYGHLNNSKRKSAISNWFCVFLGATISIGSKENMIFLVIPLSWVLADSIIKKRLTKSQLLFSTATFLFCFFIVIAILMGISNIGGRDMYGTDVSVSTLLTTLFNEIRTLPYSLLKYFSYTILITALSYGFVAFGLTIFSVFQKYSTDQLKNNNQKILKRCVAYLGCIYLIFLSQRLFYIQRWPTGIRYDFPGKLGEMFTLIILIEACLKLFKEFNVRKFIVDFFKIGYCFLFFFVIFENNCFLGLQKSAQENVQRTALFTDHINQIKEIASSYPDHAIVFQSFDAMDFEPILSIKYFLEAYNVHNKTYLKLNSYNSGSFSEGTRENSLALILEQTSKNGGWVGFSPFVNSILIKGECFSIDFSGVSNTDCINLGRIW